ncbi:MAG: ankyrin repeat domain-containing protein [Betaproteobacteria bacterium]|nr:ankyrin repeat domain-containing protein [Betaproteobacteria bacterium]
MNPARKSAFRCACPGIAGLCAIGLLAACGKPDPAQTPAVAAQQAPSPCVIPRLAPNTEFSQNDAALFSAAAAGDAGAVQQALEQGANVNASGALKRTPLFAAAFCDRPELVKLLLEKGGKHDIADANGMLPLHAAVVVGSTQVAELLITNGANVNGRDAAGRTALHVAAATNQMPMVGLLLAGKANTALRDTRGMTAAALAMDNGHSLPAAAIRQWQVQHKAPPP